MVEYQVVDVATAVTAQQWEDRLNAAARKGYRIVFVTPITGGFRAIVERPAGDHRGPAFDGDI